jgi:hypothetical protein
MRARTSGSTRPTTTGYLRCLPLSPYRQYSSARLSFPRPDEFSRLVIAPVDESRNQRGDHRESDLSEQRRWARRRTVYTGSGCPFHGVRRSDQKLVPPSARARTTSRRRSGPDRCRGFCRAQDPSLLVSASVRRVTRARAYLGQDRGRPREGRVSSAENDVERPLLPCS